MRGRKAFTKESTRPLCLTCNKRNAMPSRKNKHGVQLWAKYCSTCSKQVYNKDVSGRVYRKYKKDFCEFCGFVAKDPCQLDVDHIDGDHKNNDSTNLQTLCANCHRLKTKQSKNGMYARH